MNYVPKSRAQLLLESDAERERSIEAKIERLRQRTKNLPSDVRAVILGVLDLLADEL